MIHQKKKIYKKMILMIKILDRQEVTPNNYAEFNNELWRIVGIFNVWKQ